MDEVVKRAIKLTEEKKKPQDTLPWKVDQPHPQPVYEFANSEWRPGNASSSPTDVSFARLAIWSWNIDFMLPFPRERMAKGIRHLQQLIESDQKSLDAAHVIFLAECLESDIDLLQNDRWVQSRFALTDLDMSKMASGYYGTTTLVDRRLAIAKCFRVHYSETRMERDGLFVDVRHGKKLIRLCNTHAESLALRPPRRPHQIKLCAQFMHEPEVYGSILAGDLNAIEPFDRTLHEDNNLKDAYLESGGDPNSGQTWGQQAATKQREQFGLSRMDKVFFCGNLRLLHFQTCGADVQLDDEEQRRQIIDLGFDNAWITDHLAINAVFELSTDAKM